MFVKYETTVYVAAFVGTLALVVSLFSVPLIYTEVMSVRMELDKEMMDFRTDTAQLWDVLKSMSTPSTMRVARQVAQNYGQPPSTTTPRPVIGGPPDIVKGGEPSCNCQADNKCPPGPPGPKGPKGMDGEPGPKGMDGKPGQNAPDVGQQPPPMARCFHCPHGPMGPPGAQGRPGPRGMRGARGGSGMPGRDGQPGSPGEMGPPGEGGRDGDTGPVGERGGNARAPIGRPGPKGDTGDRGEPGAKGPAGMNGKNGGMGAPGSEGRPGTPGQPGMQGREGMAGEHGMPGKDAQYCPCPRRGQQNGGAPVVNSAGQQQYSGQKSWTRV